MKTFNLLPGVVAVCEWKKTRNGFRHDAVLTINGDEVSRTKINYLNRTWESYDYQSVLHRLIDGARVLTADQKQAARGAADAIGRADVDNAFGAIAMVAKFGDLLCSNADDRADWKARMLKAGLPGLSVPDDWEQLPAAERERRLDAVIGELTNKGAS